MPNLREIGPNSRKFNRNRTIFSRIHNANSHDFMWIRDFFRNYTNCADSRLFFPKNFIIRTVQMVKIFGKKTTANRRNSCNPEKNSRIHMKSHKFLRILTNLHHEFVKNRAISVEFTWIRADFEWIWELVPPMYTYKYILIIY
jgi:hypothetical protein